MAKVVILLLLFTFIAVCIYGAGRDEIDRSTSPTFSLPQFMGRWYEIARFDHSFERGMDRVTADYTLADDGSVEVVNSGMKDGRMHSIRGRAKATRHAGRLRVSFFWFFYFDYNVMEQGGNGEWALIGSRSPRYLWILARTPTLPDDVLRHITSLAERRGYDTGNLIYIGQQSTLP